jgi:hypothetical protein
MTRASMHAIIITLRLVEGDRSECRAEPDAGFWHRVFSFSLAPKPHWGKERGLASEKKVCVIEKEKKPNLLRSSRSANDGAMTVK